MPVFAIDVRHPLGGAADPSRHDRIGPEDAAVERRAEGPARVGAQAVQAYPLATHTVMAEASA